MHIRPPIVTADEMDHHKAQARLLRAQAIDAAFARLACRTKAALRRLAHLTLWFKLSRVQQ